MSQSFSFDVLIIGSGAAGLTLGLSLPDHINAAIISKDSLDAGSTRWAQGGVAAVLDEDDSVEAHVQDTLIA
ncbi:MAG: L-aspartate oxidase, partial [Thalassolituus sp. CG17_big_fil_post_rev_8_21_14_2_50_53_8]